MSRLFRSTESKVFFTVWVVYVFFLSNFGGNWMEDSVLRLTLAAVDQGTLATDSYVIKGIEDNAFYNGHYYSGFAPGDSFLAIPVYFVFKPLFSLLPGSLFSFPNVQLRLILLNIIATVFISSLLSAFMAVLVYRFLGKFSKNRFHKLLLTFAFSFGTIIFIYSTGYSRDVIKTFFLFASFFILFHLHYGYYGTRRGLLSFFSGLFLAFSVSMDYKTVIVMPLFLLYSWIFCKRKEFFLFVLGALIPFLFLMAYDYVAFGSPLATPYNYRSEAIVRDYYTAGFFGITFPTLDSLFGLTFSPFRGFFFYMPVMLLSVFGLFVKFFSKGRKFKVDMFFILLLFLVFFFFNASLVPPSWYAGSSFGPRYLMPAIPFMILPAIFAFNKIKLWVASLFLAPSFFVNMLGVLYGREALWTYALDNRYIIFNTYIPLLFERGLTTYTFNLIKFRLYDIPVYIINLVVLFLLLILFIFLWFVWKK